MKKIIFVVLVLLGLCCQDALAIIEPHGGVALRLRHEFWKDLSDVSSDAEDNRNFFRIKTSLWGSLTIEKDIMLYAKMTNENKAYTYFAGRSGVVPDKYPLKKGYHYDINEVVFDNLYLDVKRLWTMPVDIRFGRQDLVNIYGENFLFADGTPQDGSRTFYFNAAKASWYLDDKNSMDLLYINDPRSEEFLPVINRLEFTQAANPSGSKLPQSLNVTNEEGYAVYLKNKPLDGLNLEEYYIFKREDAQDGAGYQSQSSNINTIGAYGKYTFDPVTFRGQYATQFGTYGNDDRLGFGGYGFVDVDFKDIILQPKISQGYIYLSGDDTNSSTNENWDPLFSRFPWYSELYGITMGGMTGVSYYWTNLNIWRTELCLSPMKNMKIGLFANYLGANEDVLGTAVFSGTGKNIGFLPQAKIDYSFTKNISAYFLIEYIKPGNFFVNDQEMLFLRTEVSIKY